MNVHRLQLCHIKTTTNIELSIIQLISYQLLEISTIKYLAQFHSGFLHQVVANINRIQYLITFQHMMNTEVTGVTITAFGTIVIFPTAC